MKKLFKEKSHYNSTQFAAGVRLPEWEERRITSWNHWYIGTLKYWWMKVLVDVLNIRFTLFLFCFFLTQKGFGLNAGRCCYSNISQSLQLFCNLCFFTIILYNFGHPLLTMDILCSVSRLLYPSPISAFFSSSSNNSFSLFICSSILPMWDFDHSTSFACPLFTPCLLNFKELLATDSPVPLSLFLLDWPDDQGLFVSPLFFFFLPSKNIPDHILINSTCHRMVRSPLIYFPYPPPPHSPSVHCSLLFFLSSHFITLSPLHPSLSPNSPYPPFPYGLVLFLTLQ